jgi:hypothetical protein
MFNLSPSSVLITLLVLPALQIQPSRDRSATVSPGTARLSGVVVTTEATSRPVRRAVVTLSGAGQSWTLATDDAGRFEFADVPAGRYRVIVSKPAYLPTEFGSTRTGGVGTPVVVEAGQEISDLLVKLARGGVIAGIVRGQDNEPATNVPVAAFANNTAIDQTLTDDRGEYRIFGLPPGTYIVQAKPKSPSGTAAAMSVGEVNAALAELRRRYAIGGGPVQARRADTRASEAPDGRIPSTQSPPASGRSGYAPVFYPGTVNSAYATSLTLSEGDERDGIDFSLELAGTTDISGIVVGPDGQPVPGTQLSISKIGPETASGGLRPIMAVAPAKDGQFSIVNVTPGLYRLTARVMSQTPDDFSSRSDTSPLKRTPMLWAVEELDVRDSAVMGVTLQLQPAMTLFGRVVLDSSGPTQPMDLTTLRVELKPAAAVAPSRPPHASTIVRRDGAFEMFGILPGTYEIILTSSGGALSGWWLRSAVMNGRDLLDFPLQFGHNIGSITGAVLRFSDRHTQLSGTLQSVAGTSMSAFFVVAFPADRALWHPASRRVAFTRPSTDGQYEFRDLPPGDYVLAVLTELEPDGWRTTEFLERLVAVGATVTISEGGSTTQDLRITQ